LGILNNCYICVTKTKHDLETTIIISLLVAAYFLGSIPTAVWWGKRYYGIDVREFGSGNAGATNTFRVLGKKAGIPVLFIDIVKGTLAVLLAHFSPYVFDTNEFVNLELRFRNCRFSWTCFSYFCWI
jgi:glycerol-3-phosphate acyltransferase PlsY